MEIPLIDHPELLDFNRSLELLNINEPNVGDYNFLNFRLILKNKETGKISKTIKVPVFRILKTVQKKQYFEVFLDKKRVEIDQLK